MPQATCQLFSACQCQTFHYHSVNKNKWLVCLVWWQSEHRYRN